MTTTARTNVKRLLERRPRGEDGTMAMYLVIAVIGLALGALLVPMIVTSAQVTRSDISRGHSIDGARAGLNVMLGEIRAATTDNVGSSTKLPCDAASGAVNSTGNATYSVTITYYMDNPITVPTAKPMRCVNGYGTYDSTSGSFTPRYARIVSVGKDDPAVNGSTPGRTLTSTYTFKTTNTNIVGGQIQIYPASGATSQYCMDASSSPAVGTVVTMQLCAQPPVDQQIFAYRSDLTIQLVSSTTTTTNGLCLDTADPPTKGNQVVLKACAVLGSPSYTQQWSFNDSGGFTASNSDSKTTGALSSQCMSVSAQSASIPVVLSDCSGGGTSSPTQAWIPNKAVGAGAAASPQLINYEEFGRCLDITGQNVNANHLIDYPCKQNPKPGAVAFNQKFTPPAMGTTSGTGQLYTTTGGTKYCLTTPGSDGGYVTTTQCVDGQANQQWTVYTGDASLTYSQKYQIVDNGGRCLGLTPQPVTGEQWSAIDVEPCTGAVEQKWNASPDLVTSTLSGTTEPATGGS